MAAGIAMLSPVASSRGAKEMGLRMSLCQGFAPPMSQAPPRRAGSASSLRRLPPRGPRAAAPSPCVRLIRAPEAVASSPDGLELLTLGEAALLHETMDVVLAFPERNNPATMEESLGRTLALFPCISGRLVRRQVRVSEPGQGPLLGTRVCILCNNAGVFFSHRYMDGPMPSILGPVADGCCDPAVDTAPGADGGPAGGPLMRLRFMSYADGGQLLAVSFSRLLTDAAGLGIFVKAWAATHRGEDPGPVAMTTRRGLEASIRSILPRLHPDFALLHRLDHDAPCPELDQPVVVSLALMLDELDAFKEELTALGRKRRLIFNTDAFTAEEAAVASIADTLGAEMPATLAVDYRQVFAAEFGAGHHFGHASGEVDIDLPAQGLEVAGLLRRRRRTVESRDFWAWKLAHATSHGNSSRLSIESWLDAFKLEHLRFDGGSPSGVGLSSGFWLDWAREHVPGGTGRIMLLPLADGVQVTALLPRDAAVKFDKRYNCRMWHPEMAM